jgi:hypothetical protein
MAARTPSESKKFAVTICPDNQLPLTLRLPASR